MASDITRRSLVLAGAEAVAFGQTRKDVREVFDHLLLGISDLDRGIDWVEGRTGVRAIVGGVHPGRGTRNALLSLGGMHYLEIIAQDPAQPEVTPQFQLSGFAEPRLINFAVRTNDIGATASALRGAGLHVIGPREGSRRTASGTLLRWKALGVESRFQSDGIDPIPFFIEWARDSIHPSKDAPTGCTIEDVHFEHPRADELAATLRSMGLDARVVERDQARIVALLQTPKGRIELV